MSWAHILSLSRVLAGPIIAALVLAPAGDAFLIAALVFVAASITDAIDGKLARYSQQTSPLGVFLDTTSDKVFISLVLVGVSIDGLVPAWIPIVIIGREFLISGLRSFAASYDVIISAHIWGKGKAAVTMVALSLLLFAANGRADGFLSHVLHSQSFWSAAVTISVWLLSLSAVLTIVSGVRYVVDAWGLLRLHAG